MNGRRIALVLTAAAALAALVIVLWVRWDAKTAPAARSPSLDRSNSPPRPGPMIVLPVTEHDARLINGERPFRADLIRPARPWLSGGAAADRERARDCLAAAMWYEAGNDPSGQRAVAQVVLNRARHPAFSASVCTVVFQGMERATGCQFTFTCDGSMQRRMPSASAWRAARLAADAALAGAVDDRVGLATHYHTDWVVPIWSGELDKLTSIGTHLFFQWPGFWGSSRAFRLPANGAEPRIEKLAALSPLHAPEAVAAGAEVAQAGAPAAQGVRFDAAPAQQGDHFFVRLSRDREMGEHAVAAVNQCAGRQRCLVLGWTDSARVARRLPLTSAQTAGLDLLYQRDAERETIRWNCATFPSAPIQRCLPPASDLSTLLR